jgi:hypothetical protein
MTLRTILGAALLAASTLCFAQAPGGGAPTEAEKKARQEKREKMRSAHQDAVKACEGKQGDERHKCMTQNMCAKAPNPQECEKRAAGRHGKMKAAHGKAADACKGKEGAERRSCMQTQMCAQAKDKAKCEAGMKERMARREKAREACKGKEGDALKSCIREQRGKK